MIILPRCEFREGGYLGGDPTQVYKYLSRVAQMWYDSCGGEDEKTESLGSDLVEDLPRSDERGAAPSVQDGGRASR